MKIELKPFRVLNMGIDSGVAHAVVKGLFPFRFKHTDHNLILLLFL